MQARNSTRARFRDIAPNAHLGRWKPGPRNGITDVKGVKVDTTTIRAGHGSINTGVTTIVPRDDWFHCACTAGMFRFNGSGEMTGSHWIQETGLLHSPIVITNTFAIGSCYTGIYKYAVHRYGRGKSGVDWFLLPVVAETFDGHLNDLRHFAVTPDHVFESLGSATSDAVSEGNVGGGTGMICQGFKGGTGTSSRVVPGVDPAGKQDAEKPYIVGALVQANYGSMESLHMCGVPVGRILASDAEKNAEDEKTKGEYEEAKRSKDGSIIVILATDAPLHPTQLERLAKRATVGLARVGGYGYNASGDIFLAFSTGNSIPVQSVTGQHREVDPFKARELDMKFIDDQSLNGLLEAAADATEEAIYNALCMAETMTGNMGHTVKALPLGRVAEIMAKFGEVEDSLRSSE